MTPSSPAPAVSQTLLQKLACPNCHRSLELVAGAAGDGAAQTTRSELRCSSCRRTFPFEGSVPLLFPEEHPAEWTLSQRSLYDGVAPHYDESIPPHVAAHYRRKRVNLVRELAAAGASILDVGCGTGTLAEALRDAGYDVYGVDASTGMLAQLGAAGRGTPIGGFCERLPFAPAAFDVAITVATLHHISHPERIAQTIAEMVRVTCPGGCVVVWDHNPLNPYWPLLMKRVPQDTGEERLVPQEEVVHDLRVAGIDEIEVRRSGFVPDFTPPWLLGTVASAEWLVERTPLVNRFCAHNVVVGRKTR